MACESLARYIEDPARRSALSAATGAHPQWLYQIAVGWRSKRPSRVLAIAIEAATSGAVTCEELRPDVPWHVVRGGREAA